MVRGRSPCCDKALVKKGPWSQAEDLKLISFIQKHGHENWRALPKQAGLLRCGKSCRLRWINYLRPDIKRGNFTQDEEETVIKLHEMLGNKWSKIASHLPGRTDNEIKNVWHTHLKKRLVGKGCNTGPSASDGAELKHYLDHHQQPNSVLGSSGSLGQMLDQTSPPTVTKTREQPSSSSNSCSSSHDDQETMPLEWGMPDMLPPPSFFISETKGDVGSVSVVEDKSNTENIYERVIEIPFEPNLDFWDMLDADSNVDSDGVPVGKGQANQDTFSQETNAEVECGLWLACLEDVLGLETTMGIGNQENSVTIKDAAEPPSVSTFSNQDILAKPISDAVVACYQM